MLLTPYIPPPTRSHFVRASKYRHIYSDPPKAENCWTGFRLATTTGEQTYIKASAKYFAIAVSGGGGPFVVMDINQARQNRFELRPPQVKVLELLREPPWGGLGRFECSNKQIKLS